MEAIAVLLGTGIGMLIALPFLAFAVVAYIIGSMSMYTIAKRRGFNNAWMAWVPVVSYWMLGSIADDYSMKKYGDVRNLRTVLLILSIVSFCSAAFAIIPIFGSIVVGAIGVVLTVFQYMAYYKLYESCKPERAMTYLMLGIFLMGVPTPFLLMSCRNSDDGMPAEPQE